METMPDGESAIRIVTSMRWKEERSTGVSSGWCAFITNGIHRRIDEKVEPMGSPCLISEVTGGCWLTGTRFPPMMRNRDGNTQYSPEKGIEVGRLFTCLRDPIL